MFWDATDTEGRTALQVAAATPLQALPATFGEGFDAGWGEALAEEQSVSRARLETLAWQQLVGDAVAASGQPIANPGRLQTGSNPVDLVGDAISEVVSGKPWAFSARGRYEATKAETRAQLAALNISVPTDQDIRDRMQKIADDKAAALRAVQDGGGAGAWGALAGGLAGVMADPPNVASLALGAPAGVGVLRAMAIEAGVNMGVEASNQVAVTALKQDLGRDYGLGDAALAVGTAGVGAAGLTALGHGAAATLRAFRKARELKPELGDVDIARASETVAARQAIAEETAPRPDFDGEEAHAAALDAAEAELNGERDALRSAYRDVHASPSGDPMQPLVSLTTPDLQKVIVARGGFGAINELEISRRGWGLVKVIWGHGEESALPARMRVTEDDVVALPEIVRTKSPVQGIGREGTLTWIVERQHPEFGARRIVYGTNRIDRHPDQTLVTVYVLDPKDRRRSALPNSQEITGARSASPSEASNPPGDTAAASSESGTRGRAGAPASNNIALPSEEINRGAPDFRPLPASLRAPGDGRKPVSLLEFLRREGGMRDEGGELAAFDLGRRRPGLVSKKGRPLDYARERAAEAGYIPPEATLNDFVDAVRREAGGAAVYRAEDLGAVAAWRGYEDAVREAADLLGGTDAARGLSEAEYAEALDVARGHRAWEAGPGKSAPISDTEAAALVDAARSQGRELSAVVDDYAEARASLLDYARRRAIDDDPIPFDLDGETPRAETVAADETGRWAQAQDALAADPEMTVPWPWEGGAPDARHTLRDLFALTDEWDADAAEAMACAALGAVA